MNLLPSVYMLMWHRSLTPTILPTYTLNFWNIIQVFYKDIVEATHFSTRETSLSYQIIFLDNAGMATCKPIYVHSFSTTIKLLKHNESSFHYPRVYCQIMCALIHDNNPLVLTLPLQLTRFCQFIHIGLWYILRYLKHKTHLGLLDLLEFLSATVHAQFQNVDWAGYVVDSCSVGGYAIFLGSSKKQRMITRSSIIFEGFSRYCC